VENLTKKRNRRLTQEVWIALEREILVLKVSKQRVSLGMNLLSKIVNASKRQVFELLKKKKR
jgi:hypothetical protein